MVELKTIMLVNAVINEKYIVSVIAIIDYDVIDDDYYHINADAIISLRSTVLAEPKLDIEMIFRYGD